MSVKFIWIGLASAVFLAVVISPFASPWLDGLERVAENAGVLERGEGEPLIAAPVPDYAMPGVPNERLATSIAGVVGTVLIFAAAWGIFKLTLRKRENGK